MKSGMEAIGRATHPLTRLLTKTARRATDLAYLFLLSRPNRPKVLASRQKASSSILCWLTGDPGTTASPEDLDTNPRSAAVQRGP
jgi:hypothetical protein